MADSHLYRRYRPLIIVGVSSALLTCCGLPVAWVVGNPFERIREVEPLAVLKVNRDLAPSQHRAVGRDELLFLNEKNELEVYAVDPKLTPLRVMPLPIENEANLEYVTAFPMTPRAAVYGRSPQVFLVSTTSGEVERRVTLPHGPDIALVSPDEHWLALRLSVLTVIDLHTGEQFQFADPPGAMPGFFGLAFIGPNELFVPLEHADTYQLWDLRTRRLKWSVNQPNRDAWALAAVGDSSQIITGSHAATQVRDAQTGHAVRSHRGIRPAWAVAVHPKTGDYLAGYSPLNFSLRSGLSGAVRIWNPDGERLITFAAHHDSDQPRVDWLALSASGDYLVTAGRRTVKVWDYHALTNQ